MDYYKGTIISMDLLVAVPIALVTVYIMFFNANSILGYQYSSSNFYASRLQMLSASQELASTIDTGNLSYVNLTILVRSESNALGLTVTLNPMQNQTPACEISQVCRIVDSEGDSYELVIGNETSN